jgi:hypothetical protein
MSTHALFVFRDQQGVYGVWKHCDGYPSGGLEAIRSAVPFAWELPRFEADEFAAAFVVANRSSKGEVRLVDLMTGNRLDHQYRYDVLFRCGGLWVKVLRCREPVPRQLYNGPLVGANGQEMELLTSTLDQETA